jgi:hypothetical protein
MNNPLTYLDKIHFSNLFVDFGYQRQIVKKRIDDMARNFDQKAMTSLIVSKRSNGQYAIIDGQHRFVAGTKAGIDFFVCQVYTELTYEDEAKLFHTINNNRGPMKSVQQFKALIESNDEASKQILYIVQNHGFIIKFIGPVSAKNEIKSIKELTTAYKISPMHLDLVMKLLREIWNGDKKSLTHHVIGALSKFIYLYKDQIDLSRLVKVIKSVSIDEIIRKSKTRVEIDNCFLTNAVVKEIFKLYNKTLKNKIEEKLDVSKRSNDNIGGVI